MNFHHLQYFWAVARDGNLTRTARRLQVSQSALSSQIRLLEGQLGQKLFAREGRGLVLTEAGKITLSYAEEIFAAGGELVSTLREGRRRRHVLRVGAVATLSRNFQRSFIRPVLQLEHVRLRLHSGSLEELLAQLSAHDLDLVLSNRPAAAGDGRRFRSRQLARQPVCIVSTRPDANFRFPEDLEHRAMILPGIASDLRTEFDSLCERLGVRPRVLAEVDDMATMRLLARDTDALVLVPSVVVREELREGLLHEMCMLPDLAESFYAITTDRRFQHPLLDELLQRDEAQLFQTPSMPAASQPASVQTAGVQPASAPRSSRRKSTGSKRPGTSL